MSFRSFNSNIIRNVESNKETIRYYSTSLYPKIEKKLEDSYIVTRRGDRLDLIATEFYQDSRYWKLLAQTNNIGKGTLTIPEGTRLRIPAIERLRDIDVDLLEYNNNR